jgi:hypothetical protein
MPASFVKFEKFSEDLAKKVHDLHADTIKAYLSNAAPNVATHTVKTDIADITAQNGYTGPVDTQNTVSRSGGVSSVVGVDATITAAGGVVGPFRYVILYNDTPASPLDPLIGYWDYGSSITLADTEPFLIDFGTSMFTVT